MNNLAGYATALVIAIFAMASVFVFTGCETGIDDVTTTTTPCPDCPDSNPDPEKEVVRVDHVNGDCPVQNIEWSATNATLTRGEEYTVELADGGAYANVLLKYNATIVYSDGTTQMAAPEYTVNAAAVAFGYRDTLYVSADNAGLFDAAPAQETRETSNGTVLFLDWGASSKIAFLTSSSKSVSSLTIAGVTKTDLCNIEVSYEYENTTVRTVKEEENYFVRVAAISGTVTVDRETRTLTIERPFKVAKDGGSILPPDEGDKELVDYEVINEELSGDSWTADLIKIWSDGSEELVGELNINRSHSYKAPADKEVKVSELSYSKSSASKAENIRTGEVRNDSQYGCTITLTGMKNTLTMKTNRGTMTFAGYWEYPTIVLPNGKEFQPLYCATELAEISISDNGISGDRLPINFKANGTYGSESKELSSTLTLVKVENGESGGDDDDFIISAYGEDFKEEGDYIKWTLVTVYDKDGEHREPMSIARSASMSTDSRKATNLRTYNASNPGLTEVSRTSGTDFNYSFDNVEYTSTWSYADFSHKVTVKGRENIYYHIDGFDILVWNEKYSVSRVGVEMGVNPIETSETSETYLDLINYSLFNGGSSLVTKDQEVAYSKSIEPKPEEDIVSYNVQKVAVRSDKMLYYNMIEMHSVNTELNKTVEGSTPIIVKRHNAYAVNDWTAKAGATGILLNTYAQNYTTAKNYVFGSNRGDNVAAVELQTEYVINYMGKDYTLTITGAVQGSVELVSSTSDKNTYRFNSVVLADGVEISTASDDCVETIEAEEEQEKDVVSYNVKKVAVRGDKLYYNEIETHTINTELNKTVEKSIDLVYSLTAIATEDWSTTANATGILLSTYAQNYTTAKDYIFGSNRGDNIAKASLQSAYTVTYMGKDYTLTVTGAVQASVNLVSSTSSKNTYAFNAKLLADGQEIASDSDNCIETIEKEEEPEKDEVSYFVEKTGVRDGKLYYNEIERHTVNTDLNKTVENYVNLIYSLTATAVADWTAEEGATGISLNNSQFNYDGAKDYVFASNRGNNKATASLQTTYVVSYGGKNHNLTINGTVTGAISRTSSTSSSNTYSFTARLFADGVEIANDSDDCVERIEASEPDEPTQNIGAVAYYSAVTFTATGTPYVTFATVYNNGNCIVKKAGNVEVARGTNPGGTVTEMDGVPVRIVDNNTVYYYYRADGSAIGAVPMSEITIKGYPSGILSVKETVNADGTVTLSNEYGSATFGAY